MARPTSSGEANSSPRAREECTTPKEQEDYILRMMLRGEWKGGRSRKMLAKKWDLHERTVGDRALIASGVLARVGAPIEQEVHAALAELEGIQAMALGHKRAVTVSDGHLDGSHVEYVADPQYRDAIAAIKLKMDIRGVTTMRRGKEPEKAAGDGVDALLRSVLEDPAMRDKVQAMLAGKAKEMH
jgi:hypothetical protein